MCDVLVLRMVGENGITEQGSVLLALLSGTLDHVKLDGECHPRSNPGGEEEVGLPGMSQRWVPSALGCHWHLPAEVLSCRQGIGL